MGGIPIGIIAIVAAVLVLLVVAWFVKKMVKLALTLVGLGVLAVAAYFVLKALGIM